VHAALVGADCRGDVVLRIAGGRHRSVKLAWVVGVAVHAKSLQKSASAPISSETVAKPLSITGKGGGEGVGRHARAGLAARGTPV
jgi:hypothetical protein